MTLATMERTMSEREFRQWIAYASKRPLPTRRLEAYLANVCSVIAQTSGNAEVKLSDFLLEFSAKAPPKKAPGTEAAIIGAIAGRRVVKLGQGRKK